MAFRSIKTQRFLTLGALLFLVLFLLLVTEKEERVSAESPFRFVSWADTKYATQALSELSDQVATLNPAFTIYEGDLEDSGFTASGMENWKQAANGQLTGEPAANGVFNITFPVRGNHDSKDTAGWQTFYDLSQTANQVGATNFASMSGKDDLVYSFDYANSHFVGLDVLGDANLVTSEQIQWLDQDLTTAERRGLIHSFVFFHGPIYPVDGHCSCEERTCPLPSRVEELIDVMNKHPIITATFHGHEHTYAYTYIDETRIPQNGDFEGVTHPFHQFVTGDAGAGSNSCKPNRCDFNMNKHGFITIDVSALNLTVNWYQQGSNTPVETLSFTKQGGNTPIFVDVPQDHWAREYIEALYRGDYIAGCNAEPAEYCPENSMTRGESAVFVERGVWGGGFMPLQPTEKVFDDVPLIEWFAKWATALWKDEYTDGCGTTPLIFCPLRIHTRAEATVFFERMLHGKDFAPPEPERQYYADVPAGAEAPWYSTWVYAAYADQLIQDCEDGANRGDANFRPLDALTRAEAACMMFKAKIEPVATP